MIMKRITPYLYRGELSEWERSTEELKKTEEFKNYDEYYEKFVQTLSQEQEKLFDLFLERAVNYAELQKERAYANGVKTGVLLGVELAEFNPRT